MESAKRPKRIMKKNVNRLVIACMDRRLNEYLKTFEDSKTVFLRNAGANVNGVAKSVKKALKIYPNLDTIRVVAHTDCGGMKTLYAALHGTAYSNSVKKVLVKPFKQAMKSGELNFTTREELERLNQGFQNKMLQQQMPNASERRINIECETRELVPGEHPAQESVVVLTTPTTTDVARLAEMSERELNNVYVLHAFSFREVLPDIEIAKTLNLHKLKVVDKSDKAFEKIKDKIPADMEVEFETL